ncbi:hypothetical protein KUV80_11460 [Fictibacillus nanhaiensis]|uniref:hypothetical protein n=1 Tax=Fictibacillus nanhaiensis TaxID=742169 RepID=UPI001C980DE5|nr:hypothetical protein [Fictibacillus nanhaiensis]MBY6037278.1 hypothetical protein [Fictibacillus nanhaiensis]
MRLLFEELKKLFTVKTIILLLLVSIIIYQMFIVFDFKHFPNGRPVLDEFLATQKMLEDYGESMDEDEFEDFKSIYDQRINEATQYLQSQDDMVAAGLDSYTKFKSIDLENEKLAALHNKVYHEDYVDVFWEIPAREDMIERYEHPERYIQQYGQINEKQKARIEELMKNGAATAIFSYQVFENYNTLIKNVAILIFLSIMLVILPLYIGDRRNHAVFLQYTSKVGRTLFTKKLLAGLIASFIVITVQLVCFFFLYKGNDISMFLPLTLHSIYNAFISWYDITFLQYILLTVVSIYLIGLALVLVTACISSIAPNYMTSVGLHVPLAFILFGVGTTYLVQNLTTLYLFKYLLPVLLAAILSLSFILFWWKYKREKWKDIT